MFLNQHGNVSVEICHLTSIYSTSTTIWLMTSNNFFIFHKAYCNQYVLRVIQMHFKCQRALPLLTRLVTICNKFQWSQFYETYWMPTYRIHTIFKGLHLIFFYPIMTFPSFYRSKHPMQHKIECKLVHHCCSVSKQVYYDLEKCI